MDSNAASFEQALAAVKNGKRVARREWKNAAGIFLVEGSTFNVNRPPLLGIFPEGHPITYRPHIDMIGVDGTIGTWSPSMVDIMASDWYLVTDES